MKHIIRTALLLLCGSFLLHACSDENENTLPDANGKLVPLVIDGQLPAGILTPDGDGSATDVRSLTRTASTNGMTSDNQVIIEVDYPGMATDKGRTSGLYTIAVGATQEDGTQSCTLAPYAGSTETDFIRNENTVRVPATGKFTLRIHGMAGEPYPISHIATDVELDAQGKLTLGKLKMASAHIAIKVEGAYGEGILDKEFFQVTFETLHAPKKETNGGYFQWLGKPEASNADGSGLGNYWLLAPEETQAEGVTSGKEDADLCFLSIAAPSKVAAKQIFFSLKGVDKNAKGVSLKHGYIGKTFRIATTNELTYEASKSYTYTVRLTETTAIITNVEIRDWMPLEPKNAGNQPGIYTAQDFIDFAKAWNIDGEAGIGLKKYQQWMNYADTVKVMNNIDLGNNFTAIGTDAKPFTAIFQGDGHTITANGGALFGNNNGRIEAVVRGGHVSTEGGIAAKNAHTIIVCINEASVATNAAGIAKNNTGSLYGCASTGQLGNDASGLTTGGAAGIAFEGSGKVKGCYYLSVADDGKDKGVRTTTIKILNDAVPALNNGVYRAYRAQWKYEASTLPAKATPKLVRGEADFNLGIYTAQDFVNFAKAWNTKGNTELTYDNNTYNDWGEIYDGYADIYLYNDIDLADATPFTAIGTVDKPFTGGSDAGDEIKFHGEGHSITYKGGSLFGINDVKGSIVNLKRAGTIIGNQQGGIITTNKGFVENCINAAEVQGEESAGIAYTNEGTIVRSVNNARVSKTNAAGITQTNKLKVIACVNNGEVTGKQAAGIAVSGTGDKNYVVACVNTAAIKGEKASGIMTNCPPTGKRIIACISTRTVSGTSGVAIAPNIGNDGTNACYYISIQAQQTFGSALPNLLEMNSAASIKALNTGIQNWNTNNANACNYHYISGTPVDTAVPVFGDGAPTAPID